MVAQQVAYLRAKEKAAGSIPAHGSSIRYWGQGNVVVAAKLITWNEVGSTPTSPTTPLKH